jgi:hypothetical protein
MDGAAEMPPALTAQNGGVGADHKKQGTAGAKPWTSVRLNRAARLRNEASRKNKENL